MNIFGLGTQEIVLIVFVLLLFFGKSKLPELARSIGQAVRELKDGATQTFSTEGILVDSAKDDKVSKKS